MRPTKDNSRDSRSSAPPARWVGSHVEPIVTVITASLNQRQFIGDCLKSVARQDCGAVEHVIVDADSTDGTLDLVRGWRAHRIRLIVEPGISMADALNLALAESTGRVVAWLATDDAFFCRDAVSSALRVFDADPSPDVVYGDAVSVDETGRVLRYVRPHVGDLKRVTDTSPLVQPSVLMRRTVVRDSFLRPTLQVSLDHELWLRLSREECRFRHVPRVLAVDRDRPDRLSHRLADRGRQERDLLAIEYQLLPDDRPLLVRDGERWLRRLEGVRLILRLERDYDPAFSWRVDARWRRLVRQMLLRQSQLTRL